MHQSDNQNPLAYPNPFQASSGESGAVKTVHGSRRDAPTLLGWVLPPCGWDSEQSQRLSRRDEAVAGAGFKDVGNPAASWVVRTGFA